MKTDQFMMKPNLLIAGAPKCGTTALYTYLSEHPDIFMSPRKEPQYFGADFDKRPLNAYQHIGSEAAYLALFAGARQQTYIGEASTSYFYSTSAAHEIHMFNPQAKIIIMLRHPVEMMYSLYYQQLELGIEDLSTFEAALEAEPNRRQGQQLTRRTYIPESVCYRHIGHYAAHVQRYVEVFGWEQLKVILFDDFKADVRAVYEDVVDFLGLESDHRQDFPIVNINSQPRSTRLRNLLGSPPDMILQAGRLALPIARPVYRWLKKMNTQPSQRARLNPETALQLSNDLADDVRQLGNLLDRDLSHWLTPPAR